MMTDYELFDFLRRSLDIKQGVLAQHAVITQSGISRFLAGEYKLGTAILIKIAPLLHLNPRFLTGETSNPFLSEKLIKLLLDQKSERYGELDSFLAFLFRMSKRLDFLYLRPAPLSGWDLDIMGGAPVCAICIRDDSNNIFLIRKERIMAGNKPVGIKSPEDLQTIIKKFTEKSPSYGKDVTFSLVTIADSIYQKLRKWENIEREDIEPLFPTAIEEPAAPRKKGMPPAFVLQLRADLSHMKLDDEFYRKADIDKATLQAVLNFEYIMPRENVIALALALNKSIDEYLLRADYMPQNLKENGVRLASILFRKTGELNAKEWDQVLSVIDDVLKKRK